MPNLIVISSIIFPCMFVGLIVRDECERSVKNQVSKVDQVDFATGSLLSCEKQPTKRVTCRSHDWKMKGRARLSFHNCLAGKANPQKSLFGKKLYFALPSLYPHYIYPHYPQILSGFFFYRENPRKYT